MEEALKNRQFSLDERSEPVLHADDLVYFCELIHGLCGISLKSSKQDLVKSRIRSRLTELGMSSYGEYREFLQSIPREHGEMQTFINLLTTNKTDFFREQKHFDFLVQKLLPQWLKLGEKTLKVWSGASSTGEEPYTIAMVLDKYLPKDRDFKILATDIDTEVLQTARNAVYSDMKIMEIPAEYQNDCIDKGRGSAEGWFRIKSRIKDKVVFKRHNLIEMSTPGENTFDLIFCRNVFIYFDPASIEAVVRKFYYSTKAGGHLFIGHSESLQSIKHEWKLIAPSTFRKGG